MKSVVFLGLYNMGGLPKVTGKELSELANPPAEIWTMNDWYQFYSSLPNPDRVFQIHQNFKGHKNDKRRFSGDWKAEYNKSGAEIVTTENIPGLEKQHILDTSVLLTLFGPGFFSSTLNCMFALAMMENYENIILRGFNMLNSGEHENQLPGVLNAIKIAELKGISVDAPIFDEWKNSVVVNWTEIRETCIPYWMKK